MAGHFAALFSKMNSAAFGVLYDSLTVLSLVCIALADNRCDTGPSKGGPAAPPPPPSGSLFQPKGPTPAAPAASTSSSGMSAVFSELNKVLHLSALQAVRHFGSRFCMPNNFSDRITMLSGKDFETTSWHCGLQKPGLVCCTSCLNFSEALSEPLRRTMKDQTRVQDSATVIFGYFSSPVTDRHGL